MVSHPYYKEVLSMGFSTVIFVAYSTVDPTNANYWTRGITTEQCQVETEQFKELTIHLRENYPNITFVLQNWEGDWSLRAGSYDPKKEPTPLAFESMIQWLHARQSGVALGRDQVAMQQNSSGQVLLAAELNLVKESMDTGFPNMVLKVIPNVSLDMISYSSYDTQHTSNFEKALKFIVDHHNGTAHSPPVPLQIGEYGIPQETAPNATLVSTVQNVVRSSLTFGCPYVLFWEVYGNEHVLGAGQRNGRCRPIADGGSGPVYNSSQLAGFWLVEPDGTKTWPWHYFNSLYQGKEFSLSI